MKEVIKSNKLLVVLLSVYLIAGIFILFYFEKGEFEIIVNKHHVFYLDYFFLYITTLGEGWGSAIIILLLFLRRIYYGLMGLISILSATFIVQGMKRYIFYDYPRPGKFFENKIQLHLIDGLQLHYTYSFPSGHSAGAFSLFILLCLIAKEKLWSICYFTLALMVAFSRIYLMQHFFIDTYFGAMIGTLCAVFVYFYIQYRSSFSEREHLQRPLLKILDKR